jgi:hypothetical protein
MGQIYEDKLDGKIDEQLWASKQAEYREQERTAETALSSSDESVTKEGVLTVERIFELANKAHSLFLTRNTAERGRLLKAVLLNCSTDGVSLWPVYKKPFDSILERARNENWSALADDFRTLLLITGMAEISYDCAVGVDERNGDSSSI